MKHLSALSFAFFALTSAHAQTYLESKGNSIQLMTPILPSKDLKNATGVFLPVDTGKIHAVDTLDFKILSNADFMQLEKIYTMPIQEPEAESTMPSLIPNPEILYTIKDKRLDGIIINPRKK